MGMQETFSARGRIATANVVRPHAVAAPLPKEPRVAMVGTDEAKGMTYPPELADEECSSGQTAVPATEAPDGRSRGLESSHHS